MQDFIENSVCCRCKYWQKEGCFRPSGDKFSTCKQFEEDPNFKIDPTKINFINKKNWAEIKEHCRDISSAENKLTFFSHMNDKVEGKPILIAEVKQTIPLMSYVKKRIITMEGAAESFSYHFLDDKPGRQGSVIETLSFDFWLYKLIDDGKEYYLLSEDRLGNEEARFLGMKIQMNDKSDLSKNLSLRNLSNLMIVLRQQPTIKILSKKELIELIKLSNYTKESFQDMIFLRPDGRIYLTTPKHNLLRISQLLSSKIDGYPLHTLEMGKTGSGKTLDLEAISYKFNQKILEAANSTPKALIPSFVARPAAPGYILESPRVALIDELCKMVNNTATAKYGELLENYFGQLNFLLEHKERTMGSGNNNSITAKASCKCIIKTNPLKKYYNIFEHIGFIDPTTLSRMIIWIQDEEEQDFISTNTPKENKIRFNHIEFNGEKINPFLTIYDSCQAFLCKYDPIRMREIYEKVLSMAHSGMEEIWKARGLHHTALMLDGITKYRCLFAYDDEFTAKEEDYKQLEWLLLHMARSWNTDFRGYDNTKPTIETIKPGYLA